MLHPGRPEPSDARSGGVKRPESALERDTATLRAAARSVHRGAWWRAARREGWSRAPGVARAFGILAALACLTVGGGVSLRGSPGLFRGGVTSAGAVQRMGAGAGPPGPSGVENGAMNAKTMAGAAMVASVAAISGEALAQAAIQWKVSDGGNGHWYLTVPATTAEVADVYAASIGGTLATIESAAENEFVRSQLLASGKWRTLIGLRQLDNQPTPAAGWYWVTGEPLSYTNWTNHDGAFPTGAPDDTPCAIPPWGVENNQANQGAMNTDGRWDDIERGVASCGAPFNHAATIEWSADCNGDGVVDYGQILAGELNDANGNNIPDCCEGAASCNCPGDIAQDGLVNGVDLAAVLNNWGTSGGALGADVNGDGTVDASDLAIVLGGWGLCP